MARTPCLVATAPNAEPPSRPTGCAVNRPRPWLSYVLPDGFVTSNEGRPVDWGFPDAGGNSLGEVTFFRSYSRRKPDGTKERWYEVCARVIEGTFSILKDHCLSHRLPWEDDHADVLATEAYERMFTMRWLPPGRGLWAMGTEFVNERRDSSALQNCAFVSTAGIAPTTVTEPFEFLMMASMLGVGVGFDTKGAEERLPVYQPRRSGRTHLVADSREGWVSSTALILRAFLVQGSALDDVDYSDIRPAGTPIKGFGGTAGGAAPLAALHAKLTDLLGSYAATGRTLDSRLIVDIANLIGRCVVAGNVRRSAEIALGRHDDLDFVGLKDLSVTANAERCGPDGWSWVSNNTVIVEPGTDYLVLARRSSMAGEPGYIWLDLCRSHGRLADPPNHLDRAAAGTNPCGEQTLESYEMCTLVETFPTRCDDRADFLRTLKFAFMYAKAVTLLPTSFPATNAVMQRNRRIGCSVSGLAQFVEHHTWSELSAWLDEGYRAVCEVDHEYSRWLGVRESIKKTSVKPSGSVSLLAGVTPGVHYPVASAMLRSIRLARGEPLAARLAEVGYTVEPAVGSEESTVVAYMPCRGMAVRAEHDVTIWEKAELAALAQRHWADNQVSATITFDPVREATQVASVLGVFEGRLKSVSFLPISSSSYPQMPYTPLSDLDCERFESSGELRRLDWDSLYDCGGADGLGERFCSNDSCGLPESSPDDAA